MIPVLAYTLPATTFPDAFTVVAPTVPELAYTLPAVTLDVTETFDVNTPDAAPILPTFALPVTVNFPLVLILEPVILPEKLPTLPFNDKLTFTVLAVNVLLRLILSTLETVVGKLMYIVWALDVIDESCAVGLCVGALPKLSVLVENCTWAILAVTITLPIGELTVIPAPGKRLTDKTD